jgi:hypothetical protein
MGDHGGGMARPSRQTRLAMFGKSGGTPTPVCVLYKLHKLKGMRKKSTHEHENRRFDIELFQLDAHCFAN